LQLLDYSHPRAYDAFGQFIAMTKHHGQKSGQLNAEEDEDEDSEEGLLFQDAAEGGEDFEEIMIMEAMPSLYYKHNSTPDGISENQPRRRLSSAAKQPGASIYLETSPLHDSPDNFLPRSSFNSRRKEDSHKNQDGEILDELTAESMYYGNHGATGLSKKTSKNTLDSKHQRSKDDLAASINNDVPAKAHRPRAFSLHNDKLIREKEVRKQRSSVSYRPDTSSHDVPNENTSDYDATLSLQDSVFFSVDVGRVDQTQPDSVTNELLLEQSVGQVNPLSHHLFNSHVSAGHSLLSSERLQSDSLVTSDSKGPVKGIRNSQNVGFVVHAKDYSVLLPVTQKMALQYR
jgi:hypothetical protein